MWILCIHVYTVTCFIHYETLCWTMFYMYLLWARVEYPGWPWVKLRNGVLLEFFWISGGFENFHEPKTGWWCDYIYMSVIPETWHCDTIRKDVNRRRRPVWDHPSHGNIYWRNCGVKTQGGFALFHCFWSFFKMVCSRFETKNTLR